MTEGQLRIVGARRGLVDVAAGRAPTGAPGELCRLRFGDVAEGVVVTIPRTPYNLLEHQDEALRAMIEAAHVPGHVDAIGLGSLLAVVAGRGVSLQEYVKVPVTTGGAATTWSAVENTLAVCRTRGEERVAVLGYAGAVGQAVAELLSKSGLDVVVAGRGKALERRAAKLGLPLMSAEDAVKGRRVVVGAATTGGTLDPGALEPGTVLLDVALPPTLTAGEHSPGVKVLAAEAMAIPPGWDKGFWGRLYHVVSGYGPWQVYACLLEPMVIALTGRPTPFAQGRRIRLDDVETFGREARKLGLAPRLAEGWVEAKL
ncbi:MAG: hypothetical protein GY913_13545 [Proteobacteria bacterium]|nr:hypothetical protein [Pseudomonadota bacterium]MCP4917931.1 hypothetical protein [Pseudomonadota bacterium]